MRENESLQLLSDAQTKQLPATADRGLCPQAREGQDRNDSQGASLGCAAWAGVVPLPSCELPAPTLHYSATAALAGWGGTSQIRRNNGLGRGQVRLGEQQKRGL